MAKDEDEEDQVVTPIATASGAYPLLRQAAEDRIKELAEVPTDEARKLSAAFRSIVAILMSWSPTNKPTEEERTRLQEELFAKNRLAATVLERHAIQSGKPPWQPPPRPPRPPKKG